MIYTTLGRTGLETSAIGIGQVNRLLDQSRFLSLTTLQEAYRAMPAPASACTECGACVARCPFGVDVTESIKEVTALFESVQTAELHS